MADAAQTRGAPTQVRRVGKQQKFGKVKHATAEFREAGPTPSCTSIPMEFYEESPSPKVAERCAGDSQTARRRSLVRRQRRLSSVLLPGRSPSIQSGSAAAPPTSGGTANTSGRSASRGPLINAYVRRPFPHRHAPQPRSLHLHTRCRIRPATPTRVSAAPRSAISPWRAARLDYFGLALPYTFTENYIDFRDHQRYAAIRDVNRGHGADRGHPPVLARRACAGGPDPVRQHRTMGFCRHCPRTKPTSPCSVPSTARPASITTPTGSVFTTPSSTEPLARSAHSRKTSARGDLRTTRSLTGSAICIRTKNTQRWKPGSTRAVTSSPPPGRSATTQYRRPLPAGLALLGLKSAQARRTDHVLPAAKSNCPGSRRLDTSPDAGLRVVTVSLATQTRRRRPCDCDVPERFRRRSSNTRSAKAR